MTPKDKAQELFDKFDNYPITMHWKKECAMICVDEVLSATSLMSRSASANFTAFFYQQVKQEIEKL